MTRTDGPPITVLSNLFHPDLFGGLEHVLWRLSNALVDRGRAVQVICENTKNAKPSETIRPGFEVIRRRRMNPGPLWRVTELVRTAWWRRALSEACPEGPILANDAVSAFAVITKGWAHRLVYRPVFCQRAMHHVATVEPEMAGMRRRGWMQWMDAVAYRRAGAVVLESENLRAQYTHWVGDRPDALVIPNAAPLPTDEQLKPNGEDRASLGIAQNDVVFGFVGRPGDPCKDLPFLLQAWARASMPSHAKLLVVGHGEGTERVRSMAQDLGLMPASRWTGRLKDPTPAYRAMDVLVLPSRFETFGNVLVEAAAHGVPGVARRRSMDPMDPVYAGGDERLEHGVTGWTCDPYDPVDLASLLRELALQPTTWTDVGRSALIQARATTWNGVADRYLAIAEALVPGASSVASTRSTTAASGYDRRAA